MQLDNASRGRLTSNAVAGAKVGLIMGLLLALWVGFLALVTGSTDIRFRHGESVNVGRIIVMYLLTCPAIGALIGGLRRLMRYLPVAIATGIITAIPLAIVLLLTVDGTLPVDREGLLTVAIFALAFGGGGGIILHKITSASKSASG